MTMRTRLQLATYLDALADNIPHPSQTRGGQDLHKAAMREAAQFLRAADLLLSDKQSARIMRAEPGPKGEQ